MLNYIIEIFYKTLQGYIVGICIFGYFFIKFIVGVCKDRSNYRRCLNLANIIKNELEEKIDKMETKLKTEINKDDVDYICGLGLTDLIKKIKTKKISKINVLMAYQYKAIQAHRYTNCLTDVIEDAEKYIDDEKNGIFEGVPVSFKDGINVEGCYRTLGCTLFAKRVCKENDPIVNVMIMEGAVPFVKTNMAQLGFSFSCSNPIYGETFNPIGIPKGIQYTPGGSSGGEAALIRFGGSILGFGSDMGGSIRIPSSMCGLYGLKPTSSRWSYSGIRNNHTKQDLIRTVKGPMSSDLDGLILSTKALTSERMFNCDSSIPPIPFNENIFNSTKKLKVGFFTGSGVCQVLPPMKRVVAECAKHFENLGFEVEEWNPPLLVECANDYFFEVILSESGNTMSSILKKDLVDKSIAKYIKIFHFPDVIKRILPFWSYFVECGFEKTLYKYITGIRSYDQWKNVYKNILVARDEIKKSWIKHNFDIVLFPAFTCPAFDSKLIGKIHGACWPTMYFNLADFPSGVFPYSSLTSQDMNDIQNFQSNQKYLNKLKTICKQAEGFPLSVQIAAMPFKEEKILLAMKNLKNILN